MQRVRGAQVEGWRGGVGLQRGAGWQGGCRTAPWEPPRGCAAGGCLQLRAEPHIWAGRGGAAEQ